VETKIGINRYSVINKNPVEVRSELKAKTAKAIKNLNKYKLKKFRGPYVLKIELMCPNMADEFEKIGAARINHNTIELKSNHLIDLWAMRNGWASGVHNKMFNIK
jgi:D-aminopeptidase